MALDSCQNFVNLNAALRLKNANNCSHFNIYEDICNAPPSVEFYSLFAKGKPNPDWCGSLSACADSHTCIAPIVWHIKKQAPSERFTIIVTCLWRFTIFVNAWYMVYTNVQASRPVDICD